MIWDFNPSTGAKIPLHETMKVPNMLYCFDNNEKIQLLYQKEKFADAVAKNMANGETKTAAEITA